MHFRIVLPDGTIKHLHSIAHPLMDESGEITEIVGTLMDVTRRKRGEALRDGESHILEMIARDAPLEETLESLVRVLEAQFAGLLCSVLLLDEDGQHVRHGAAPSLPEAYAKAIDGLCIGPKAGSCGTAVYRREPVVVTDILQDPLWEAYREWPNPMGSEPAGPLPYSRIRVRRWARLPCITANRATRSRLRPVPWKWLPTSLASPSNASWRVKSANDCVKPRRISRT